MSDINERLTYRNQYGVVDLFGAESSILREGLETEREVNALTAALDKLAAYEDADEQGLLATLHVKIGQKVYRHRYTGTGANRGVVEWVVSAITFLDCQKVSITFRRGDEFFHCEYGGANWRVTYMTRAEAEAALKGGA